MWSSRLHALAIGLVLSVLVSCGSASSCSPARQSGDGVTGGITLTCWSATNADEVEFVRQVVAEWNAKEPLIQVQVRPIPSSQSSEEVVLAAIASRTTPDIYANAFPGAMQDLLDAKGVVRLDDFPDFLETMRDRMPTEILDQYRAPDGHFYQVPWKTNPILVQYNTGMLRQAGIARLPETYAEFLAAAARVTRDRDGDGRVDQWMSVVDFVPLWHKRLFDFYTLYLAATDGQTLLEGRRVTFDNDKAVAIFEFFRQCFANGYIPKQSQQGDMFLDGRVASRFTGPWSISHVERYRPEGFEYDFGPIPRPEAEPSPSITYADPKSVVVFTTCEHPREAWEFVKFLVSRRNDLRLLEITNQLPIRAPLVDDAEFGAYFDAHPRMVAFARQAISTRSVDQVSELRELFDIVAQEFEASAVFNTKTPEQGVRDAARRSQTILDLQ
jgi:multiple sugar transport system substrate-binding protein